MSNSGGPFEHIGSKRLSTKNPPAGYVLVLVGSGMTPFFRPKSYESRLAASISW